MLGEFGVAEETVVAVIPGVPVPDGDPARRQYHPPAPAAPLAQRAAHVGP
ncbi:hypothetical protein [Tessaracoccus sp.]